MHGGEDKDSATRTRRSAKEIGLSSNSAPRTTRVSRAIANGWSPLQPVEISVPTVFARPSTESEIRAGGIV